MGRPRMKRDLPQYASAFIDVRGKERIRFRRKGWSTHYAKADPASVEFGIEYRQWLASEQVEARAGASVPGSFDDLIARYYRSPAYLDLADSTQSTYRGELERFRAQYGSRSAITIQAKHIQTLLGKMGNTPSAANNLKKRLGMLFRFAIVLGWRTDNPASPVKSLKTRKGGFPTWQETHIAKFEAKHPVGTMARLAFDLALYTAQRRSDLAVMGPQHIEDGDIRVRQLKTDALLYIPIHPKLAASIAATPSGHLAFIVGQRGKPYTKESLGNWFRERCDEAGVTGFSLHGLRKAASRRMAETGLSNQLIKSITGHVTDSEVSRYTRDANQRKMARLAMPGLANKLANTE